MTLSCANIPPLPGFEFPPIGVGNAWWCWYVMGVDVALYAFVLASLYNAAQRGRLAEQNPVSELSDMMVYALSRKTPRNSPGRRSR